MRIHLSLELTEARLRRVEELTAGREYAGATGELWSYQALVEDTLRFLDELKNTGKTRDLYRRVEITLRGHAPRLEAVRRVTPYEHAVQIKTVAAYVRDARADALNAFYGDTVVRGSAFREPERSAEDQHSKDKSASELSKRP